MIKTQNGLVKVAKSQKVFSKLSHLHKMEEIKSIEGSRSRTCSINFQSQLIDNTSMTQVLPRFCGKENANGSGGIVILPV